MVFITTICVRTLSLNERSMVMEDANDDTWAMVTDFFAHHRPFLPHVSEWWIIIQTRICGFYVKRLYFVNSSPWVILESSWLGITKVLW